MSQGRVVDDPRLAPATVVHAQEVLDAAGDGWSLWRAGDWASLLRAYRKQRVTGWWAPILVLVVYVALILSVTRRLTVVIPFLALHVGLNLWLLVRFSREAPLRARQSRTAKLYLLEEQRRSGGG